MNLCSGIFNFCIKQSNNNPSWTCCGMRFCAIASSYTAFFGKPFFGVSLAYIGSILRISRAGTQNKESQATNIIPHLLGTSFAYICTYFLGNEYVTAFFRKWVLASMEGSSNSVVPTMSVLLSLKSTVY